MDHHPDDAFTAEQVFAADHGEPEGRTIIWRAYAETRHYTWEGFGHTITEAREALKQGFERWCARNPDADPDYFAEVLESVSQHPITLGACYMDRTEEVT